MATLKTLGIDATSGQKKQYKSGDTIEGVLMLSGGTMTGAITLAADPVSALQPATKQYVDNYIQGLDPKASVVAATTTAGTLASSFENGDTIDGITLATNDRILIKDQADPAENGIYVVNASGAPTRASDMNTWAEVVSAYVFVETGTANADKGFVCTSDAGGTLGTTAINFVQFTSQGNVSGSFTAGQIAFATGGSTLSGSNSLWWDNSNGRFGIGTNSPSTQVHFHGGSNDGFVHLTNTATGSTTGDGLDIGVVAGVGDGYIKLYENQPLQVYTNNVSRIYVSGAGYVNINHTSAQTHSQLFTKSNAAGVIALTAQAAASQTANIQEWRDSSDNPLSAIGPSGYMRLYEAPANGTSYTELRAAASLASSTTFVLPTGDGTQGQVMQTDGSANLSFVTTEFVLSTTTGIDGLSTGTTNLYTVPAGKTAYVTKAVMEITTATGLTGTLEAGIGVAAGEDDIFASTVITGFDLTTEMYMFNSLGVMRKAAAADVIKFGIDTAFGGTTVTLKITLIGYLV